MGAGTPTETEGPKPRVGTPARGSIASATKGPKPRTGSRAETEVTGAEASITDITGLSATEGVAMEEETEKGRAPEPFHTPSAGQNSQRV